MRRLLIALAVALPLALTAQSRDTLDIYLIDVEGGNATLYVAPSGESLLIDTGNGGAGAERDAGRILAAVRDAGVTRIDTLITTHYHGDHFGAMEQVVRQVPVRAFIDHGPSVQSNPATDEFLATVYPRLRAGARHTVARPGDVIAMTGLDVRVVTSGGEVIRTPLSGGGRPNPFCAAYAPMAPDTGENGQSVGTHITFGRFRTIHLGDLTWNKEHDLMCPANPAGMVDLFVVSHHGQAASNSPVLLHALAPRVMVMNNGTRKGGQPDAMRVLHGSPGLEDLWQLHFSELSGQEYTVPGMFIANPVDNPPASMPIAAFVPPAPGPGASPAPTHNGQAYWIKVSAKPDGSFTVTNARNGFSKTYAAR